MAERGKTGGALAERETVSERVMVTTGRDSQMVELPGWHLSAYIVEKIGDHGAVSGVPCLLCSRRALIRQGGHATWYFFSKYILFILMSILFFKAHVYVVVTLLFMNDLSNKQ
jgi:hypothetical protein